MTREEAIDRIKDMHSHMLFAEDREALETLIPELRESEDERIRKGLIEALKASKTVGELKFVLPEPIREECIAYLEKQKELPFVKDVVPGLPGLYFYDGERMHFQGSPATEEKQKEQKPLTAKEYRDKFDEMYGQYKPNLVEQKPVEWSEEDKDMLESILDEYKSMATEKRNWLNSLPERVNLQPKQQWSEEEKQKLNRIYSIIGWAMDEHAFSSCKKLLGDKEGVELQDFLRSIAKPAEWSEEDEDMLNSCISSIEEAKENRYAYKETDGDTSYDHEIDWLKSLRPSWKPSEEQMETLLGAKGVLRNLQYNDWAKILASLYEQLKKL